MVAPQAVRVEERAVVAAAPRDASLRSAWRDALAWGGGSGVAVGVAGGFASFEVWMLAVVSGISFATLGWRSRREAAPSSDWFATALQLAFLSILCGAAWDNRTPPPGGLTVGAPELSGLALIVAGLALRRRAMAAMGEQFTVRLRVDRAHRLVTSGPYRRLRHPNYAGLALVAYGTATLFRSPLAALAATAVWLPVLLVRMIQEEHALARSLGGAYREYARRTRRLIPGIY